MTDEPLDTTEVPEVHQMQDSEFARLRKRREQIGMERTIDLPINGYGGMLIARYHLLDWATVRRIAKRLESKKGTEDVRELWAQCDTLISACDGFFYRQNKNGSGERPAPVQLINEQEQPIRYDRDLAEGLGFDADTARQVVLGVFTNELALSAHHAELVQWMQGETEDADEDFLGES